MSLISQLTHTLGEECVSSSLPPTVFTGAADRTPLCVVRPRSFAQVPRVMEVLAQAGAPVSVVGGGHGPRAVVDGVTCLDLRSIPAEVTAGAGTVTVNGSARVADLLSTSPARVVPVGVLPTPGLGLLTLGGVGGLTRSLGLSIDSIESVEFIDASGQRRVATADGDADFWFAARGAAAALGVVSALTMRTHDVPQVFHARTVARGASVTAWSHLAPTLPRATSCSVIVAPATDGGDAVVLYDVVSREAHDRDWSLLADDGELLGAIEWTHAYRDMPAWDVPENPAYRLPDLVNPRWRTVASWLDGERTPDAVAAMVELIRRAPTPWCRLEFQHVGGALGDVADDASAMFGRSAEHSAVMTAQWPAAAPAETKQACLDWVAAMREAAAPAVLGSYATDLVPGMVGQEAGLREVFGSNLPRLRTVAEATDPDGRFRCAPPFVRPL